MRLADLTGRADKILQHRGGCASCPRKRIDLVEATLIDSKVILVGEAPGATEVQTGEGFTGASGELLRTALDQAEVQDFALTNVIKCRPPDNKTPTKKEIDCCMAQYTATEVVGYPIVVLVGNVALQAFFPGTDARKMRGNFAYHPDYPGQRFFAIYHPAYILRDRRKEKEWKEHIDRLGRALRDPHDDFRIITPGDISSFNEACDRHLAAKQICLDIETNGYPAHSPGRRITSVAFTSSADEVVVCHEDWPIFTGLCELVGRALQDRSKQILGHNIGYDIDYLERELNIVCKAGVVLDTMALAYQAYGWTEISLKELVSRVADGYRHLIPWPSKERDSRILEIYNAEDVVKTFRAHRAMMAALGPRTLDLYLRVAGKQSLAYQRMQSNGVHFVSTNWAQAKAQVDGEMLGVVEQWEKDDADFKRDMVSGNALQTYLFETKGLPVLVQTRTGKPSTDENAIKDLRDTYEVPYLEHLLEWRRLEKLRSTYIDPLTDLVDRDGRIHPHYVFTTTDTGRRSCRKPNYQNQPRNKLIRSQWGVMDGRVFLQADFSQIELRIGVSLANSIPAIEKYNQGVDLHHQTAVAITGSSSPSKEDRTKAKSVNFALLYGGSAQGLMDYARHVYGIHFTEGESKRFVKIFFNDVVPGLDVWHQQCRVQFQQDQGYLLQVVGHQHQYSGWDAKSDKVREEALRSYINAQCQGPAAYLTAYTIILAQQWVMEAGLDALCVGDVHDSVHFDCHPDAVEETIGFIETAVHTVEDWAKPWFKVPLVMDYEKGTNWGNLEPI